MFTRKVPLYYFILLAIIAAGILLFIAKGTMKDTENSADISTARDCNPYIVRLHGYKYVNQLLYAENECESKAFTGLKQQITDYINEEKAAGKITAASVYVRIYNTHGEWFVINPNEEYHASSLLKLPVLFTFARMAEFNPDILEKKVTFNSDNTGVLTQKFTSKKLVKGQTYTIRDRPKSVYIFL